jgi:multiple antibiotic resistance protein
MASAETDVRAPAEARKLPLTTLTAMIVGSMVGAGVFSLPRNFALATDAFGALITGSPLAGSAQPAAPPATSPPSPQSVLFTPLTFPLTIGGPTFAFGVAASAFAPGIKEKVLISIAAIAYAVVTGITLYLAGHVQLRVSGPDRVLGRLHH